MKELTEAFFKLREAFGGPGVGTVAENHRALVFRHSLGSTEVTVQLKDELGRFLSALGGGVSVRFEELVGHEPSDTLEVVERTISDGDLNRFLSGMPAGTTCRAVVEIDKQELVRRTLPTPDGVVLLYFYRTQFVDALNAGLLELEQNWFKVGQKLFLILGEPATILVGPVLCVLGAVTVDTVRKYFSERMSESVRAQLLARVRVRDSETHWHGGPKFLTPEYLDCDDKGATPDAYIKPLLDRQLMALVLGSLANYTRDDGGGWTALVEGRKRTEIATSGIGSVDAEAVREWVEIYDWVYESRSRDKIGIVRNLITLQPYDTSTKNYGPLIEHAHSINISSRNHFERFIGESVDEYFDDLKEVTGYMQAKVDAIGQQVSALADAFVKNLIATAGFVVGTVVSKLLNNQVGQVYPFILAAFAVYAVVLVAVYYPTMWRTNTLNTEDYNRNLTGILKLVSQDQVDEFIGEAFKRRRGLFLWVWWSTLLVHVVLAGGGLYYALKGP